MRKKILFVCCFSFFLLVLVFCLTVALFSKNRGNEAESVNKNAVTNFEIGTTYSREDGKYLKLLDDDSYILFDDQASIYKTDEELKEETQEEEAKQYLGLYLYEGQYKKEGENLILEEGAGTKLMFANVDNFKKKIYFKIDTSLHSDTMRINYSGKGYYTENRQKYYY